uniref:Uncharacterized protein n=1 Tax=Cuerna arida TaxID=1464854 RepID=A0A1B6FUB9_9HEMI
MYDLPHDYAKNFRFEHSTEVSERCLRSQTQSAICRKSVKPCKQPILSKQTGLTSSKCTIYVPTHTYLTDSSRHVKLVASISKNTLKHTAIVFKHLYVAIAELCIYPIVDPMDLTPSLIDPNLQHVAEHYDIV